MGDFRQLVAWQESNALACDLHAALDVRRRNVYPGLRDQILRAAGTIPDCLAEGCAKRSRLELARFADMAYAAAKEVESQLERARTTRTFTEHQFSDFATRLDRVARLCFGLSRLD
jgi:four helix bundle protein